MSDNVTKVADDVNALEIQNRLSAPGPKSEPLEVKQKQIDLETRNKFFGNTEQKLSQVSISGSSLRRNKSIIISKMSKRQSVVRDISQAGVGVNALMLNLSCQNSLNKMSFVDGTHRSNIRDSKVLEEIPEQTPDKDDLFEEDQSIKSINHVNLEFEKLHYLPPDVDRGVVFKFVVL